MKKKTKDYFWMSFSDLMTSLFFVMLVLFVLTFVKLKQGQSKLISKQHELEAKQDELLVENEKLNKILKLEEQFKPLQEDGEFIYLSKCKKYISKDLRGVEIFEANETTIKEEYMRSTIATGEKLESLLFQLNQKNPEFSYLIIIEGNVANNWETSYEKDDEGGYMTSYRRALAVYNLWIDSGIGLRKYNSEILICGSGFNGLCRDDVEEYNKRFSIQIVPKIEYSE